MVPRRMDDIWASESMFLETLTHFFANSTHDAAPIPLELPLTRATLPASVSSAMFHLYVEGWFPGSSTVRQQKLTGFLDERER
jgi:hypothetical protein